MEQYLSNKKSRLSGGDILKIKTEK